jgi:hypothetical protein
LGVHTYFIPSALSNPAPSIDPGAMARVLICEPHDDIRAMLELVVRRLGHEPVAGNGPTLGHAGVDVAVIEPG